MPTRLARRSSLRLATGVVVVAALSLTGCQSGAKQHSEGAHREVRASAPAASHSAGAAVSRTPEARQAHATVRPRTQLPTTRAAVVCTSAVTKVTARKVPDRADHLLVTATNTGRTPCYAYYAPYLRFGDAQAPVPFMKLSAPQAVVTLDPGQSAYAAVLISAADGSGEYGRTVHRLEILFANRDADGSVGSPATVSLPPEGVYVDSGYAVTYWQATEDEALAY